MGVTADEYLAHLIALLPPGLAVAAPPGSVWARLLGVVADALSRADQRADHLLAVEADPRAADELLADWERAYGLPDPCLSAIPRTGAQRRADLIARITDPGRQRPSDFIAIAAALGVSATLIEYRPEQDGDDDDAPIRGLPWAHTWEMRCASGVAVDYETVTDDDDTPLSTWIGVPALECLLSRLKPAHTCLIVSYDEGD